MARDPRETISAGFKLPDANSGNIFTVGYHRLRNRVLNAFLKMQIISSDTEGVEISGDNVVIKYIRGARNGADGMHYEFEYDNSIDYTQFAVVRVQPGNAWSTDTIGEATGSRPGVYIAIQDVPAGSAVPRNLFQTGGENAFWQTISEFTDCPTG